jgi:tetratricopeptide (TPR) repeat protein
MLGCILLSVGMTAAPAWSKQPKEVMQAAVSDFEKITLPTLIKMEPLIEKSAAERLAAYKALKLDDTSCYAAIGSGYRADQVAAESAARVCVELAGWLGGNDIDACFFGGWDSLAATRGDQERPDARIEKGYREHRIKEMHDRLQIAAGCAQKDKAYWARRAVDTYHSVAGGPKTRPDGKLELSSATSQAFLRCDHVGYLAGKDDFSKVAGAAIHGCSMLGSYLYSVRPELPWTCNELRTGLNTVALNPGKDVLEAERPKLKASLEAYYAALKCGGAGATSSAVASAAPAQSVVQKANELVAAVNLETGASNSNRKLAETWEDRGEYDKACSYYSQALTGLAKIYSLRLELTHVTGDPAYTVEAKKVQEVELELRAYAREECKAHGHPIF